MQSCLQNALCASMQYNTQTLDCSLNSISHPTATLSYNSDFVYYTRLPNSSYIAQRYIALPGVDYVAVNSSVVFPAGSTWSTIRIPILPNSIPSLNKEFTVNLISASLSTYDVSLAQYNISSPRLASGSLTQSVLNIGQHDYPNGMISFNVEQSILVAPVQPKSSFDLTLTRSFGLYSTVSVDWSVPAGTSRLSATSGTVIFTEGQTTANITVQIIVDSIPRGNETIVFALGNPIGGASIGTSNINAIILACNNVYGLFSVSAISQAITVNKQVNATSQVSIIVARTVGSAATINVGWSISGPLPSDVTAIDGSSTSGSITFLPGQLTGVIVLSIAAINIPQLTQYYSVQLVSANSVSLFSLSIAINSKLDWRWN